jgi:DNA-directed RNA polymerase subunit RPC12/RpoP
MRFSIIPRRPGIEAVYRCGKCSHLFKVVIPIFRFLGLEPKCPHCGSRQVSLDNRVRY